MFLLQALIIMSISHIFFSCWSSPHVRPIGHYIWVLLISMTLTGSYLTYYLLLACGATLTPCADISQPCYDVWNMPCPPYTGNLLRFIRLILWHCIGVSHRIDTVLFTFCWKCAFGKRTHSDFVSHPSKIWFLVCIFARSLIFSTSIISTSFASQTTHCRADIAALLLKNRYRFIWLSFFIIIIIISSTIILKIRLLYIRAFKQRITEEKSICICAQRIWHNSMASAIHNIKLLITLNRNICKIISNSESMCAGWEISICAHVYLDEMLICNCSVPY